MEQKQSVAFVLMYILWSVVNCKHVPVALRDFEMNTLRAN